MRKPIPPIVKTVDDLKQRLHLERNVHKQQRLQMLYLLATGQAHERQQEEPKRELANTRNRHSRSSGGP